MTETRNDTSFLELVATTELECAEMNPSYWFADPDDEDEPGGRSERAIAVTVCKRCPIRYACFRYAIDNDIQHGVWGGSIPAQRTAYRQRMAAGPRWS